MKKIAALTMAVVMSAFCRPDDSNGGGASKALSLWMRPGGL